MQVSQHKSDQDFRNFGNEQEFLCGCLLFHEGNFVDQLIFINGFDFHPNPILV